MLLTVIIAVCIANIPGISILGMWVSFGTLRISTMIPTILTIFSKYRYKESSVFYSVVVSWCFLPVFIYGNLTANITCILIGSACVLLTSCLPMLLFGKTKELKI